MADVTGTMCTDQTPPRAGGVFDVAPALLQQRDEGEAARASGVHMTARCDLMAGRPSPSAAARRTRSRRLIRGAR